MVRLADERAVFGGVIVTSAWQPQERDAVERQRRAPVSTTHLVATFASGGRLLEQLPSGPVQIVIEATDAEGNLAPWFHDDWFAELIHRFGDEFVTLRIAPTPEALLHPCVCHEVEMVRRVLPHWRVVATGYLSDVQTAEDIRTVAASPFHEVRFFDQVRSGTYLHHRMGLSMSVDELIGRIRRHQSSVTGRTPVLVRLPAQAPVAQPRREVDLSSSRSSAVPGSTKR